MNTEQLQLFEEQTIRTAWDDEKEEWYFSVVDVVGALTESVDPTSYWRKLKQRLKEEGNETVTNCHALKMKAADGKRRFTDVANTEQLLRIIQSTKDISKVAKICCSYVDTLVSGRLILQNGKVVGAVTHVLVNDPTRGYGIFIENMLEAAKQEIAGYNQQSEILVK